MEFQDLSAYGNEPFKRTHYVSAPAGTRQNIGLLPRDTFELPTKLPFPNKKFAKELNGKQLSNIYTMCNEITRLQATLINLKKAIKKEKNIRPSYMQEVNEALKDARRASYNIKESIKVALPFKEYLILFKSIQDFTTIQVTEDNWQEAHSSCQELIKSLKKINNKNFALNRDKKNKHIAVSLKVLGVIVVLVVGGYWLYQRLEPGNQQKIKDVLAKYADNIKKLGKMFGLSFSEIKDNAKPSDPNYMQKVFDEAKKVNQGMTDGEIFKKIKGKLEEEGYSSDDIRNYFKQK